LESGIPVTLESRTRGSSSSGRGSDSIELLLHVHAYIDQLERAFQGEVAGYISALERQIVYGAPHGYDARGVAFWCRAPRRAASR